jgi:hypothetical protein
MNGMSEAKTIRRLVLTGLLVVGGSVIASVVCTHISFMDGSANPYSIAMRCSLPF